MRNFTLERGGSYRLRSICLYCKFGIVCIISMKIWHHFPRICTRSQRIVLYGTLLLSASGIEFEVWIIKNNLIIFYLLFLTVMLPPSFLVHFTKSRILICIYLISWSGWTMVKVENLMWEIWGGRTKVQNKFHFANSHANWNWGKRPYSYSQGFNWEQDWAAGRI